jgi:hypothetical protein
MSRLFRSVASAPRFLRAAAMSSSRPCLAIVLEGLFQEALRFGYLTAILGGVAEHGDRAAQAAVVPQSGKEVFGGCRVL